MWKPDKYDDPIELTLVKMNGTYWALNDDDFDHCSNCASDYSHSQNAEIRALADKFEYLGTIRIPKAYFEDESGPYVA